MAGICCPPPLIPVLKSAAAAQHVSKIWIFNPRKPSVKRTLTLQIASSIRNKVFEDRSKGVICYKDDQGEIICEGYDDDDEPHFHQEIEETQTYQRSDAEVKIDLILQQSWLPMVESEEPNNEAAERGGLTSYIAQFKLYLHVLLIVAFVGNRS